MAWAPPAAILVAVTDVQGRPMIEVCGSTPSERQCLQRFSARPIASRVRRFLPARGRAMVGPWCLVDEFQIPADSSAHGVGPHPHCGLSMLTWVLSGRLRHRDSLGGATLLGAGQGTLLNAGRGVSHAEERPEGQELHALQLWMVQPNDARAADPYLTMLRPATLQLPAMTGTVLLGTVAGVRSAAPHDWPAVAALISVDPGAGTKGTVSWLPLHRRYEHALIALQPGLTIDDDPVPPDEIVYLGSHRDGVEVSSPPGTRFLLIGGLPFEEQLLMWWNFVAERHVDLVSARALWSAHTPRFGTVADSGQPRVVPPVIPQDIRADRGPH